MSMRWLWTCVLGVSLVSTACGGSDIVGSGDDSPQQDIAIGPGADAGDGATSGQDSGDPDGTDGPEVSPWTGDAKDASGEDGTGNQGGVFGAPCETNDDCYSGYCVDTHEGGTCSKTCETECPDGWSCEILGGDVDPVYVCLPHFSTLCVPCLASDACVFYGTDQGARCVVTEGPEGIEGAFCGGSCAEETCPEGYTCSDVIDVEGTTSAQCIPEGGAPCACTERAVAAVATTACTIGNELGVCEGERWCDETGLTACSALTPSVESCNGVDDDCSGETDEPDSEGCATYYLDGDEDGFGVDDDSQCLCAPAAPYTAEVAGDCADDDALVYPDAEEVCNGVDDNCSGETDEGFEDFDADEIPDCVDDDDDGDGDDDITDCEPLDPAFHAGAEELCNGLDDNCNQITDETFDDTDSDSIADCVDEDDDDDGSLDDDDCAPLDGTIHPAAEEVCDGVDNNCVDGIDEGFPDTDSDLSPDCLDDDDDGDGDPDVTDCEPLDATIYTGAEELCNGVDDNCNQIADENLGDTDADGIADCVDPDDDGDGSLDEDDCAPLDPAIHPGAEEVCDGIDNDCSGIDDDGFPDSDDDGIADCVDSDLDGDGHANEADNCPETPNEDQEDLDEDTLGDLCDGDIDGDGSANEADCAPTDLTVHPAATEICDGIDQDCDGDTDEGFGDIDTDTLADCVDDDDDGDTILDDDDNCPTVPNTEQEDQDGDQIGDACEEDLDGDGDPDAFDCKPEDETVHHSAVEVCNGTDENCNGIADEGYPDSDGDGIKDCVDDDDDADTVLDEADNCPLVPNLTQINSDDDEQGNACDVDDDNDETFDELDCAPLDGTVYPGALEVCNDKDDDCDNKTDEEGADGCVLYYYNQDGDSFGITVASKCLCEPDHPYTATQAGDCQDTNGGVFPGATEVCNGTDDNCDNAVDEIGAAGCIQQYVDNDFDQYGTDPVCVCAGTPGYATAPNDCDDTVATINPGMDETCGDGLDNDCDESTDEPDASDCVSYWRDHDTDTFGVLGDDQCLCAPDGEYTATQYGDCDDNDALNYPTNIEVCDGQDNDCDILVDEGTLTTYWLDGDDDGFGGDGLAHPSVEACEMPEDYVDNALDCDDEVTEINPQAEEICDGLDNNCVDGTDEGFDDTDDDGTADCVEDDTDGDGDPDATDCAPLDPDISSDEDETCGDGVDNDCNDETDEEDALGCEDYWHDGDDDLYGVLGDSRCLCEPEGDYTATQYGDCEDGNSLNYPQNTEVCDGQDNDCDTQVDEGTLTTYWLDDDDDGYGGDALAYPTTEACSLPEGYADNALDCDDSVKEVNPLAEEICDGVDNNCVDGIDEGFEDSDKDGTADCVEDDTDGDGDPNGTDCAPNDPDISANADEVCDDIDNDCDTSTDEAGADGCDDYWHDGDGDDYGVLGDMLCLCEPEGKYTALQYGDCDDSDGDRYPTNQEVCDTKDNNCNGGVDENVKSTFYFDNDEDGYGGANSVEACEPPDAKYVALTGDCNDFNGEISPGKAEACDVIDNDCDGQTDEDLPETTVFVDLDGDGHGAKGTSGVDTCLLDEDEDGTGESPPDGYSLVGDDCDDSASTVFPSAPELCDGVLNDCDAPAADYHCPEVCAGEWPVTVGVTVGWPVAVQLDETSQLEVIAQGGGKLFALRSDGSLLWEVAGSPTYSYPVLADFNGDGHPDPVLFEGEQVRILRSTDGAVLETYSVPSKGFRQGVVFDLDNDGHLDLVTPTGSQLAIVLRDGAGGAKTTHIVNPPASTYFHGNVPGAVDIDDDGIVEVIVGTGYYTCNGGNAPACSGRILVLDPLTGSLVLDPDVSFAANDPSVAYAGGPRPFFVDTDNDGDLELFHHMGGAGLHTWNLDGTPTSVPAGWGSAPRLAPVDGTGTLDLTGQLHDIGGGAIDLNDDGQFEIVRLVGDGLIVEQDGQVMDGYPVNITGSNHGLMLSDINRDGRADVLFVGNQNASVNCYTVGEQTFSEAQLLTNGNIEPHSAGVFHTGSIDPYEPNQATGFDPTTATDPIAESRAFPMRGFKDLKGSSSGWTYALRAVLGTKGDRDFYWAEGTQISTSVTRLVGPLNPDLYVHMYKPVGDSWEYVTTRSSTDSTWKEQINCHKSDPCPDASATGMKLFLIEVRPHDAEVDYGPWPYRLRIIWGAG